MRKTVATLVLAGLLPGTWLPSAVYAADADLLQKIEALSKELESLKKQVADNDAKAAKATAAVQSQVKRVDDKSLGKWLTVNGDYRFRIDSLSGETQPFTDVNATFANAQAQLMGNFFANPTGSSAFFPGMSTSQALTGLMGFSQAMGGVQTYDQARAFLGNPQTGMLLQGLGAFAAMVPEQKPKNDLLYTNRFGLDLNARATQNVSVSARLLAYKTFGAQDEAAITNAGAAPFFADRVGVFDGVLGHVPSDSYLAIDRAYATLSNIADLDLWFSVGRRPSTGGAPSNFRLNQPKPGKGGTPALLVDYAFDGMTLGYAPDIEGFSGAYAKLCYGRGFESGFKSELQTNSLRDTDMVGISVVPVDTDPLRVWLQWNRGMNIFDAPVMKNTYFGNTAPKTNLGDIDWFGAGFMSTFKQFGPGDLNVFGDVALSVTHPNQNVSAQFGFQGLLTGGFFNPEAPSSKTGNAIYLGARYDLPSATKIGFEFNRGSKNWITFAPAADEIWTAKVGTRGNVYEAYLIQEIGGKAISSYLAKAFFRLGFIYYDFQYTGSNNWVGAPVKIGDVNGQFMTLTPMSKATNAYASFEARF